MTSPSDALTKDLDQLPTADKANGGTVGRAIAETTREICPDCRCEMDPEVCHCGDPMDGHSVHCGHTPVPMGCQCGYDPAPYCSYGHRTKARCDCGPIADNE